MYILFSKSFNLKLHEHAKYLLEEHVTNPVNGADVTRRPLGNASSPNFLAVFVVRWGYVTVLACT